MNKPPAFQFYPKDFLMDDKVAVMNLEQKGAYVVLLSYCWNNKGLSREQDDLKELCGNPENWPQIWEKVGKCFYEKNGKLFNKRLLKEFNKQKEWRKKSSLGGIQSGISRGKKVEANKKGGSSKNGSTKSEPKANSSSPSSSSSPINKDIKKDGQNTKDFDPLFEEFWKAYPKKIAKEYAKEKFMILARKGLVPDLIKATHGYLDFLKSQRIKRNFEQEPLNPATFMMKNRWRDYIDFRYRPKL